MADSLCEHEVEEFSAKLSFEHNLKLPKGIASSMEGNIIVADIMKGKVFDSNGDLLYSLCLPIDDELLYDTVDVDTDNDGNVYLLVWIANEVHAQPSKKHWHEVFVFDKDGTLQSKFPLRAESRGRKLAVFTQDDSTEILVLEGGDGSLAMVEVYRSDGSFVGQFGEGDLTDAQDIVTNNKGHIYVLDKSDESQGKCVHEFSADGTPLRSFRVDPNSIAIAYDRAHEHIVIASSRYDPEKIGFHQNVSIYDGSDAIPNSKLLRSYCLDSVRILLDVSITVNTEGLIAVVLAQDFNGEPRGKLIVMEETTKGLLALH